MSTPTRPVSDAVIILAISLLLAAVYLATAVATPRGLDEMSIMAVGRSLQGRLSFDDDTLGWTGPVSGQDATVVGPDGHSYTPKDVSASIIAAPFIWIAYRVGASPIHAAHLSTILVAILTAVMVFLIARGWGYGRATCALAALTFGLASQAWPYATSLMTQSAAGLGLTIALWGVDRAARTGDRRAAFLGGLGMTLAGLSATTAWIAAPVFALAIVPWEKRQSSGWRGVIRAALPGLAAFCAAAALGLIAAGAYNAARFGSPLDAGQSQAGNLDFRASYWPVGLFGLLVSAPEGLIWFAPVVVLAPFGAVISLRAGQTRRVILPAALIVLFVSLYGSYFLWWADTEWGPRYLVPLGSCFVLLASPVIDRIATRSGSVWGRAAAIGVLAFSALTQLIVTLLDFGFVSQQTHDLLTKFTPPASLGEELPFLANPRLLPYVQAVSIARSGKWAVLWAQDGRFDRLTLGLGIALAGLAGVWLWIALRGRGSRFLKPGLIAQAVLSVGFAGMLLTRYPHSGVPFGEKSGPPDLPGIEQAVAYVKKSALPGDGVVTLLYPTESFAWHDYSDGSIHDIGLTVQPKLDGNAKLKLEHLPDWFQRVWLVSDATAGANPDNAVERALARRAFVGEEKWFGNWRVISYAFAPPVEDVLSNSGAVFGEQGITLREFDINPSINWIGVRLDWHVEHPIATNYSVFVHVLDSGGKVVAQHDGVPMAGYAPTTGWGPGQTIIDRHALLLPPDLPGGMYRVTVGLYDPSTGARLAVSTGGDALTLESIELPMFIP